MSVDCKFILFHINIVGLYVILFYHFFVLLVNIASVFGYHALHSNDRQVGLVFVGVSRVRVSVGTEQI